MTALHSACTDLNFEKVKIELSKNKSLINAKTNGKTPLHCALHTKGTHPSNLPTMPRFFHTPYGPLISNPDQHTLLNPKESLKIVTLLLDAGADPSIVSDANSIDHNMKGICPFIWVLNQALLYALNEVSFKLESNKNIQYPTYREIIRKFLETDTIGIDYINKIVKEIEEKQYPLAGGKYGDAWIGSGPKLERENSILNVLKAHVLHMSTPSNIIKSRP